MLGIQKNQGRILEKLGIEELNEMQEEAMLAISSHPEVILLSPTGTGKTLAFLLPILEELDRDSSEIQVLIVVPSRELAIQIEHVAREMGSGFKTNAIYGGTMFQKDKANLKHRPAILVGTPGRIADHMRRDTFSTHAIKTLILDEFDKSLEVGFESEMSEIVTALTGIDRKILTSATQGVTVPNFVRLRNPLTIDYLQDSESKLKIKTVISPSKDKLETLIDTLSHLGNQSGIIFCNFKDSISRVSAHLNAHNISHGVFYGGMEQNDRERSLIKFRNGTYKILLATDLAARGIDVPEIKFIIHYHLPIRKEEFTHRNGRTARMNSNGTAYVLKWAGESLPHFIPTLETEKLITKRLPTPSPWTTIFISGGRKDKISKGDIAGTLFKKGNLKKDELGIIELKHDCAFVAVKSKLAAQIVGQFNNTHIKKRKVRVYEI